MRFYFVIFFIHIFVFSNCYGIRTAHSDRSKREAVGELHIITNHEQPIHKEVKTEGEPATDKPCKQHNIPYPIEMGAVFQVTPPKVTWFEGQSLRKSLPITSKLDLIRSVSRAVTLSVLLVSGVIEFYPLILHLYQTVYNFIYL